MLNTQDSKLHLKNLIERLETLEREKKNIADHIRDVLAEAKASGYDTKIIRRILKIRGMDEHDYMEQEEVLTIYLHALGMAPDPLEDEPIAVNQ